MEYDFQMPKKSDRSLGLEFWAIIGTGVAIAALILTVAHWQRADMHDLGQKIEAMQGTGSLRKGDARELRGADRDAGTHSELR